MSLPGSIENLITSIETILNGWEKEDQILALSESISVITGETINIRLKEAQACCCLPDGCGA